MSASTWSAIAAGTPALDIVREIATRLHDPKRLAQAIASAPHQSSNPYTARWQASSIACGSAGLAVLCATLDKCFPDEGWDQTGHVHLRLATQALSEAPVGAIGMGLFSGVCGVAFSAWLLSRGASRYQHLLASLEEAITQHLKKRVPQFLDQKHGYASSQFDVISGLAGMGAYLLCRRSQPPVAEALTAVLHALILLSEDEQGVPHWFTPPALMSQEQWRGQFPDGLLDSGLAHGIAGPLALLALAKLEDVVVEGMDRALERMSTWLVEHRLEDDWGINWPCASPPRMLEASQTPLLPARTAWCYGAPGIARALWLSGQALHQEAWCDLALTAMQAVYRKPGPARQVDAPTFCHGVAGLLQITLRFARETGLPLFQEAAESLTRQLLELYEPGALFGFLDLEPGERRIDQAGLLTGAAGTTLVLLSAATSCESAWDRLFLLA